MLIKIIITIIFQVIMLLFLLTKDKNNGEKVLFQRQRWKASDVVISVVIFNIFLTSLYFISLYFKPIFKLNFAYFFFLLSYLISLFIFLIILGFIRVRYQQDNIDYGFKKSIHAKLLIIFFVLGSILFITLLIMLMTIYASECLIIKKYFYYIQFGFFLIFITPVLEELIYRGIVYSVYRKKYDSKWAIIISSLLFGLGHTGGVGLPIIIGIVCGMIYERKESLPMAICAHGLINAGGFICMILFNQINVLFT